MTFKKKNAWKMFIYVRWIFNWFLFFLEKLFQEFLKCTIDIADLLGLAVVLSRIPGKGHSKLITAGLGWATAEVILTRGLMLWVGARGAEFSWLYIQKCLESNISLVISIFYFFFFPPVWLYIFGNRNLVFFLVCLLNFILDSTFDNSNIDLAFYSPRSQHQI